MLELLVAMTIVAILAMAAIPSFQEQNIRNQIAEALPLADMAKTAMEQTWKSEQEIATENSGVGLPSADKIVNNYIRAIIIDSGAIHITFGNRAHRKIKDKILSIRAAIVEDAPTVPITWVCGFASVPGKMTAKGVNKTNIPKVYLPLSCR